MTVSAYGFRSISGSLQVRDKVITQKSKFFYWSVKNRIYYVIYNGRMILIHPDDGKMNESIGLNTMYNNGGLFYPVSYMYCGTDKVRLFIRK
jgi:hypothetical protein